MTMAERRTQKGFTLIEILVVVAIMGLVMAAVPPLLSRLHGKMELRASVRGVTALLREARNRAIASNGTAVFYADLRTRNCGVAGGGPSRDLPEGIALRLTTTEEDRVDDQLGGIRFFPDGSSSGGGMRLAGNGVSYEIKVDWLSGRVSVAEAEADRLR